MGMNALVFNVLKEIGINPERFSLQWASAAEAPRFVKLITDFTAKVKELGPLGESEGIEPEEIKARLEKGLVAVNSRKVRMVYGNTAKAIRKEAIFTQEYISGVIEEKLSKSIAGAIAAEAEEEEGKASASEKKPAESKAAPGKAKAAAKKDTVQKAAAEEKPAARKPAPKPKAKTKPAAKKKAAPKKTAAKKASTVKKKPVAKKKAAKKKK
jgi:Methyl-viologen-reducing hydrogenase, delta subunit